MDHDLKCKSDSWKLSQASRTINNKNLYLSRNENQNNITEQDVDVCNIDIHNKQSVLDLFEDKLVLSNLIFQDESFYDFSYFENDFITLGSDRITVSIID